MLWVFLLVIVSITLLQIAAIVVARRTVDFGERIRYTAIVRGLVPLTAFAWFAFGLWFVLSRYGTSIWYWVFKQVHF